MAQGQLEPGTLLNGRYRILRALGRGGMGTVYQAQHEQLETIVAVKEVFDRTGNFPDALELLEQCQQEARFLVHLHHPNLPKVTDAFVEDERFYLVMEYIEGVTLEDRLMELGDQRLDVAQVVDWGLQIADVLDYLHSQEPPIIFRDLKPANIMVRPDGTVCLIDFGIARRFQPGAHKDTSLLGSIGYSPPEQFGQRQTDIRSDIFAFGATLHHLLTGRDPSAQPFKFPLAHLLNPAVPLSLTALLERCLGLEPEARPDSIKEVRQRLEAAREDLAMQSLAREIAQTPPPLSPAKPVELPGRQAERAAPPVLTGFRPRSSTGHIATTRNAVIVLSLLALIIGATTLILARTPLKSPSSLPTPSESSSPLVSTEPESPLVTAPAASSNGLSGSMSSGMQLPPSETASAQLRLEPQGLTTDAQGNFLLPILAVGNVWGRMNADAVVTVFFYDANGNPILAQPQSAYAYKDGRLYVSQALHIPADEYALRVKLVLPVTELASIAAVEGVRARGLLYLDGKQVVSTGRIDVMPGSSYGPYPASPQGGIAP